MEKFKFVFKKIFTDVIYAVIALSVAINALLVYYLILLESSTLSLFLQSNNALYNILSIAFTALISILFGLSASLLLYHLKLKQASKSGAGRSVFGGIIGAFATGCPTCGAWLVSAIGIGGGLAAFPFQGLELKGIALLFLSWSVYSSASAIYNHEKGVCYPLKKSWQRHAPIFAGIFAVLLVLNLPIFAAKYNLRFSFQPDKASSVAAVSGNIKNDSSSDSPDINLLFPEHGYKVNASYGDIGPKMIEAGVIDLEKFKQVYERSGRPLTEQQLKILTEGSDEKIIVKEDNSHFLLNFFWAFGLLNKNSILETGPLMKYGGLAGAGNFASTGGWTLAKSNAMDYYSKSTILVLDDKQQKELEDFTDNAYRPCCNNSTTFSDCNHGMALLGLGQIMAAQAATAQEMFEAGKYFNSFWFPQQYLELAQYFQAKEGKSWPEVEARTVMGKDYSSASGWSRVHSWLQSNGLLEQAPSGGGGCGV
ncbi:MAG: hypothetical protein HYW69_01740 [Candidatus Nealsonbacteria bacterium]|nr:hypothetical protein [Candidatus Nealsonbacteria bacterium]